MTISKAHPAPSRILQQGPRADWWQITTYCKRPSFWDTLSSKNSWCSLPSLCSLLHPFPHCFLEVTSNHLYLNGTTTTNHQGFIHFIQTSLSLRVNYLFGSLSSTRNNCTKIKRSLQNCLVHRYTHRDFFKTQSFQKKNRKFSPLFNLFSVFSLCNAIMSFLETGHTSRS